MKNSKLLAVLAALFTALAVLSGAVAVPLLCRPFYYAHIGPMGLEELTGLTRAEIRQAFDQVMDYCLGLREDFAAGILPFSASGASHFADVRGLFLLDLWVLGLSLAGLAVLFAVCRKKRLRPSPLLGHGPGFWAACGLGGAFLAVGAFAAADFDRAFVVFHQLFFPGKDNWLFNWWEDPVILILPEAFFRNCAILILGMLLLWCAVLIAADLWFCRRRKRARRAADSACGGRCDGCSGCG